MTVVLISPSSASILAEDVEKGDSGGNSATEEDIPVSEASAGTSSAPVGDDADDVAGKKEQEVSAKKLRWYRFGGVSIAQGYNMLGLGRGALVMSNIFLSTAFIYLASQQAGCVDEQGEVLDECQKKVYGFKPSSFVSNIAVISGVLSALFMPFIGAVVDCTSYRRATGIFAASAMILVQVVQIGTTLSTWLAMAILQAIGGFLYQMEILAVYAYLPDMASVVGESTMTTYTATFVTTQFTSQSLFLLLVIVLSIALSLDDVTTAQMSQGLNALISGTFLCLGWRLMPTVPARRKLEEGQSLWTQGFVQVFHTGREINRSYKTGLRWFFLCVIMAEAAANAFTVVSVIYLDEQIGLNATEIGIFFLVTLLGSLPGSFVGSSVAKRTDPKRSWICCMGCLTVWAAGGAILFKLLPKWAVYVWGIIIGVFLGWFYCTENLFFSLVLPKGQEAELSGFFVYCTQILGWLPPLIFTAMVEANVSQTYAVVAVCMFFPLGIVFLLCAAPWNDILKESRRETDIATKVLVDVVSGPADDAGVEGLCRDEVPGFGASQTQTQVPKQMAVFEDHESMASDDVVEA